MSQPSTGGNKQAEAATASAFASASTTLLPNTQSSQALVVEPGGNTQLSLPMESTQLTAASHEEAGAISTGLDSDKALFKDELRVSKRCVYWRREALVDCIQMATLHTTCFVVIPVLITWRLAFGAVYVFLTDVSMQLQSMYFTVYLVDLFYSWRSGSTEHWLRRLRDDFFTTVVFPLSMFVFCGFYTLVRLLGYNFWSHLPMRFAHIWTAVLSVLDLVTDYHSYRHHRSSMIPIGLAMVAAGTYTSFTFSWKDPYDGNKRLEERLFFYVSMVLYTMALYSIGRVFTWIRFGKV